VSFASWNPLDPKAGLELEVAMCAPLPGSSVPERQVRRTRDSSQEPHPDGHAAGSLHRAMVPGPDRVEHRDATVHRDKDQEVDTGEGVKGQKGHVQLTG
jgi:hypothetical protein